MSTKKVIETSAAPAPIGPYSQAIKVNNTIYLSGQIGINPMTGELINDSIRDETIQIFTNIKSILESNGNRLSDIVKLTIFIRDFQDFPIVNEVMKEFFQPPYPTRSTIGVASLPKNARIEIECIAVVFE